MPRDNRPVALFFYGSGLLGFQPCNSNKFEGPRVIRIFPLLSSTESTLPLPQSPAVTTLLRLYTFALLNYPLTYNITHPSLIYGSSAAHLCQHALAECMVLIILGEFKVGAAGVTGGCLSASDVVPPQSSELGQVRDPSTGVP